MPIVTPTAVEIAEVHVPEEKDIDLAAAAAAPAAASARKVSQRRSPPHRDLEARSPSQRRSLIESDSRLISGGGCARCVSSSQPVERYRESQVKSNSQYEKIQNSPPLLFPGAGRSSWNVQVPCGYYFLKPGS